MLKIQFIACIFSIVGTTGAVAEAPSLAGEFRAVMIPIPLSAEFIRQSLPRGLEYRGSDDAMGVITAGMQVDVKIQYIRRLLNYKEVVLAIPHIYLEDDSGPYTHLVRLYLDNRFAISGGVHFYGMPKVKANFTFGEQTIGVDNRRGRILDLVYEATGEFEDPSSFANFANIKEVLLQPMVHMTPLGRIVKSKFDWGVDTNKFTMRPLRGGTLLIGPQFEPNPPVLEHDILGIDLQPWGALEFVSHWTLEEI